MLLIHPNLLWLMLAAPLLAVAGFHHARSRRWLVAISRALAVALMVIALCRPVVQMGRSTPVVVAVVDLSPSAGDQALSAARNFVDEARRSSGRDDLRVVVFSNRSRVLPDWRSLGDAQYAADLRRELDVPLWPDDPTDGGSALADALQLAGGVIGAGGGEVRLFTDGVATRGDAAVEALRLAQRGIAVRVTPMQVHLPPGWPTAVVRALTVQPRARLGETLDAELQIEALQAAAAQVGISSGDALLASARVSLSPGINAVRIPVPLHHRGLMPLRVSLASDGSQPGGGDLLAAVDVAAPLAVTVCADPNDTAAAALSEILGDSAQITTVAPQSLDDGEQLRSTDLLVVSDVPVDQLTAQAQANIRGAVRAGAGLFLTGAARSFGPGGWGQSPLADMLPVRMPQQMDNQDPSTTLVLIIDTSGSMTGTRIALAKEVARLALRRLQPHDKVGILEFYGNKRWAAPIQSAANSLALNRALNRLDAGGGTVILPAIEEAAFALRNVNTRTRHVLLLTDGGVEDGPFETIARKMADDGISISTVLCGPGLHSDFLASLAEWGNGRFYWVADQFSLPEIILRQPQTYLPPPLVQTPVQPEAGNDPLAALVSSQHPLSPISGYVRATAKPAADVILQTHGGDALLARWRCGVGSVAVMPTQLGSRWTDPLQDQPQFASLLRGLVDAIARRRADGSLRIQPIVRAAGVEVDVTADQVDPSGSASELALEVSSLDGSSGQRKTSEPVGAGHWNVLLPNLGSGTYKISARTLQTNWRGEAALALAPPREFASLSADWATLSAIEQFAPLAQRNAAAESGGRWLELWKPAAILGLLLVLLNVAARRWPVRPGMVVAGLGLLLLLQPAAPARADSPATQPYLPLHQSIVADGDAAALLARLQAIVAPSEADLHSLADVASEQGDLPSAAAAIQKLLQIHPTDGQLLAQLADVREMLGDDESAQGLLEQSIQKTSDPSVAGELRLRLAILQLDMDDSRQGTATLRQWVGLDGSQTTRMAAALVSDIYGQDAAVAQFLKGATWTESPDQNPGEASSAFLGKLWEGDALSRQDKAVAAAEAFQMALSATSVPRDRRFVTERLISAARVGGALNQLADQWLSDPRLPSDRIVPLATVLRELGRVDDLLKLRRRPVVDAGGRDVLQSARFINEVIGAANDAGRGQDAEAVCREVLDHQPNDLEWLGALARLLVEHGKSAEAQQLFVDRIHAERSPQQLAALADLAQSVGQVGAAMAAAQQLISLGTPNDVTGCLLSARLLQQRGQGDQSLAALGRAARAAGDDPKLLLIVAQAYEHVGAISQASKILDACIKHGGSEDALSHLAWLYEQQNRLADAQALWLKLWQSAPAGARKTDARQRLLNIASRSGTLADLADQMEEKLADGHATPDDLALLVDIYVGAGDALTAAETIQEFRDLAGGEANMLDRLATLYLRCERFGQADQTLRKLLVVDPSRAVDTLQEIAVVALERKRPADAEWALRQVSLRTGENPAAAELRAGVLDQLNRPADSAREYRRAIEANPAQVEDWLLWANAKSRSGQKPAAIARLEVLISRAASDDLFLAGADGLLNLDAPRPAIRYALRRAIARVAESPRQPILYELVCDLCEPLGEAGLTQRTLIASLPAVGEQRSEILRQLMQAARSTGDAKAAENFGCTLLALGDAFPPDVFLDLGAQLLDDNRPADADRAFTRAVESSDDPIVFTRITRLYEQAGEPRKAMLTIQRLIARRPFDAALAAEFGGLYEQLDENVAAVNQYLDCLALVVHHQLGTAAAPRNERPAGIPAAGRPPAPGARPATGAAPRPYEQAVKTLSESDELLGPIVSGLLATSTDPDSRHQMLLRVSALAEQCFKASASLPNSSKTLTLAAGALRRLCVAAGSPEASDALDRKLVATWPKDGSLVQAAVDARIKAGLFDRAAAFTDGNAGTSVATQLARALASTQPSGSINAEWAGAILPQLIIRHRQVEASAVLAAVPEPDSSVSMLTLSKLLAAAAALGDPSVTDLWARRWFDAAAGADLNQGFQVANFANAALWTMSRATQQQVIEQIVALARRSDGPQSAQLALLALRVASSRNVTLEAQRALCLAAVSNRSLTGRMLSQILAIAAPADRPAILRQAAQLIVPMRRRAVLLDCAGALNVPIDGPTREAFVQLVTSNPPPPSNRPSRPGDMAFAARWYANTLQPQLLRDIAQGFLRRAGSDPVLAVNAAVAMSVAGDGAAADQIADRLIRQLRTAGPAASGPVYVLPPQLEVVSDAVSALSAPAKAVLLAETRTRNRESAWQAAVDSIIADKSGDRPLSLQLLKDAFARWPRDAFVRRLLLRRLEVDFRFADEADLFLPYVHDPQVVDPLQRQALSVALGNVCRFDEALSLSAGDDDASRMIQRLQFAYLRGDSTAFLQRVRAMLVANRSQAHPFVPSIPEIWNGGMDHLAETRDSMTQRPTLFELAAERGVGISQMLAWLDAADSRATDYGSLLDAVINAAREPGARDAVLSRLESRCAAGAMTDTDRSLLMGIAQRHDVHLSPALLAELWNTTLSDDSIGTYSNLASALVAQGDPRGQDVSQWLSIAQRVLGRFSFRRPQIPAPADIPPPLSGEFVADSNEAMRLGYLIEQRDLKTAVSELGQLRESGAVSYGTHPQLAMTWARIAAEQDDLNGFSDRLNQALTAWMWQQNSGSWDVSQAMPGTKNSADVEPYVSAAMAAIQDAAIRYPAETELTRQLCLLGVWCKQHALDPQAAAILAAATKLADEQGDGEHQLWVADLAGRLGRQDVQIEIQRRLLADRCLPAVRIVPLLQRLDSRGQGKEALQLATAAYAWCPEQALIQWIKSQDK